MITVTFEKEEEETLLMAIFLDKMVNLGRCTSVIENPTSWTVRIETGH